MAQAIIAVTETSIKRLEPGTNGSWHATRVAEVDAQCIAADPLNRQNLYAGCQSAGVLVSDDGGKTWKPVPNQPPILHVSAIAVSQIDRHEDVGALYVGTEPSSVYRSRDDGVTWDDLESLRQIPSAPKWSFPARPWTHHIRWISPSPHDPDLILVVVELGGIMRSADGGKTWRDHPKDAYLDCHALAMPTDRPGLVYECAAGGFAVSTDAGLTWSSQDSGIDKIYLFSMAVDFVDTNLVYVGASPDARHAHYRKGDSQAAIYRRKPEGSWEPVEEKLPPPLSYFPYGLATHPDEPDTIYAGFADGSIAIGHNRGNQWTIPAITGDKLRHLAAMIAI